MLHHYLYKIIKMFSCLNNLMRTNLTIAVDLCYHGSHLLLGRVLSKTSHHDTQLLRRYSPVTVLVEQSERFVKLYNSDRSSDFVLNDRKVEK